MLVVLGDSFCSSPEGWPQQLADKLELELFCKGNAGAHWWLSAVDMQQNEHILDQAEVIVFCHTNASRIPTDNIALGQVDHSKLNEKDPMQLAIKLYFAFIENFDFLNWTQGAWFDELSSRFQDKTVVHLHSFPWSYQHEDRITIDQISVSPSLATISLNETGATSPAIIFDQRPNHLNHRNNTELANQLYTIIEERNNPRPTLDLDKFEQATRNWDNWQ